MFLKKILSLLLIFTLVFSFACSKDDNPAESKGDELVGTWVLTNIILINMGNQSVPPGSVGISATIIMRSDRTFEATYTDPDGSETTKGTWSAENNKLTLKRVDGGTETFEYTLQGNKLTLTTVIEFQTYGEIPVKLEFTKQ